VIGPQIFAIIKGALMDPELENLPTDYTAGLDFRIAKTQKGGYADYNTSKWARKESALTEAEQAAIEKYGLFDLSTFLPKKPTSVELNVIKEMFEASVDGQPFDAERWGQYYRPAGMSAPSGAPAVTDVDEDTPVSKPAVKAPVAEQSPWENDEPAAASAPVSKPAEGSKKAEDILAMIRSRTAK
jgi:hypothetical protein